MSSTARRPAGADVREIDRARGLPPTAPIPATAIAPALRNAAARARRTDGKPARRVRGARAMASPPTTRAAPDTLTSPPRRPCQRRRSSAAAGACRHRRRRRRQLPRRLRHRLRHYPLIGAHLALSPSATRARCATDTSRAILPSSDTSTIRSSIRCEIARRYGEIATRFRHSILHQVRVARRYGEIATRSRRDRRRPNDRTRANRLPAGEAHSPTDRVRVGRGRTGADA